MPKFLATFTLYRKDENGKEKEFPGVVPSTEFSTETTTRRELWQALQKLEKELSKKYNGDAMHLLVTACEAIPECHIKKDEIVIYNDLEL